jgi:replicative DNA helicase
MTHRLPADLPLERDVIASCLLRPEAIPTIGLGEDDFALDAHRIVWRAMLDLHELGGGVDYIQLRSRLIDTDNLGKVGGEQFLATLRQSIAAKKLPIDRLHKLTRLRTLRAQAEAVAAAAAGNDADLASAALEAARGLDSDTAGKRPKTARQLADEWYASLNRDPNEGTVSPGLDALKRIIGRLDCGSMTLVGADTNVGKSSLAFAMMVGAIMDKERVGYLSMEDPERIVTERLMSVFGQMSAKKVRRFRPDEADSAATRQIGSAMQAMHLINDELMVSDCIGMNERETLEQMTHMATSGCRLIVLDYIGVVGCSVKQQDRRNEIRWIATRFKARAVAAKVAIIIVSQFQRPKEGDSGKKPNKHSFRESGDLEAMAEYAIVMWRKVEDDYAPIYCELAKSKTGGVGYGFTMQREVYPLIDGRERPDLPGSGRLVEVCHDGEVFYDDRGNQVDVRRVMPDPMNDANGRSLNRWKVDESSR